MYTFIITSTKQVVFIMFVVVNMIVQKLLDQFSQYSVQRQHMDYRRNC